LKRLTEFRVLTQQLKQLPDIVESLQSKKDEFKSDRLKALLTYIGEEGGLLPMVAEELKEFDHMIVWKKAAGSDNEIPEPQPGLDDTFDNANNQVNEAKAALEDLLDRLRKEFKERKICFTHAKQRYEIEFPSDMFKAGKKPNFLEFSSKRQGFDRFVT